MLPVKFGLHLAMWFQRRRFFEISANQKQELPVAAIFVVRSRRNKSCRRMMQTLIPPLIEQVYIRARVSTK